MLFLDADISCRDVYCNTCYGTIGGARLFCIDCVPKPTVEFNTVNLCCEPQCLAALVPLLPDFEVAHEPNHRLVKARIPVLLRHYGRIYSAALGAFERIRYSCARIAESAAHPQEEEKTGSVGQETPNHEPTFAEMAANVDKVDDAQAAPQEEERTGAVGQETPDHEPTFAETPANVDKVDDAPTALQEEEKAGPVGQETPNHEPTFAEMPANVDKVDDAPAAPQEDEKTGSVAQETPNHEPTSAEMPANVDKVDDAPTAPQEEEKTGLVGQETPNHEPTFAEIPASVYSVKLLEPPTERNLPTCGNCNGRLSFPCWYCMFCIGGFPRMKLLSEF